MITATFILTIISLCIGFICIGMISYLSYQIKDLKENIKNLYYNDRYQISYLRCLYINQLKLIENQLISEEHFEEVQKVQELIQNEIDKQKEDIINFKLNNL